MTSRFRGGAAFSLIELLVAVAIIAVLIALLFPALASVRESSRRTTCASGLRQWGVAMLAYRNDHRQHLPCEGAINSPAMPDAWYNALPPYVNAQPYGSIYDGSPLGANEGYANDWIWHCPTRIALDRRHSTTGKNAFHYGMNAVLNGTNTYGPNLGEGPQPRYFIDTRLIDDPARTLFLAEAHNQPAISPALNVEPQYRQLDRERHDGSFNALFIDAGVRLLPGTEVGEPVQMGGRWRSGEVVWGPFW